MLTLFRSDGTTCHREVDPPGPSLPADTVWFDLVNPNPERRHAVEAATGLSVPTPEDVEEIENSSRLYTEGHSLHLSMPVVTRDVDGAPTSSSLGFVLSPHHLVTVRSGPLPVSNAFIDHALTADPHPSDAGHLFVFLLETIVEHAADSLEHIRDELDATSRRLFKRNLSRPGPSRNSADLSVTLQTVGQTGDVISRIRDSMLALGRIVAYVAHSAEWLPQDLQRRLQVVGRDISSLSDYDTHLANKTQFLLDATLGFINIEQNYVIKVLAVVGTVGVPPTLVASIYGMNFENMPELHFRFGYPLALLAILVSAALPLMWFVRRGWL